MNVYDTANKLAQEIKQSEEFLTYQTAKQAINLNFELKQKIDEFEKTRYEVQAMSFQGKDDPEKMQKLQEMYNILNNDKKIKEYFDIEVRFNIMLADVNKIISESVKDLL